MDVNDLLAQIKLDRKLSFYSWRIVTKNLYDEVVLKYVDKNYIERDVMKFSIEESKNITNITEIIANLRAQFPTNLEEFITMFGDAIEKIEKTAYANIGGGYAELIAVHPKLKSIVHKDDPNMWIEIVYFVTKSVNSYDWGEYRSWRDGHYDNPITRHEVNYEIPEIFKIKANKLENIRSFEIDWRDLVNYKINTERL